MKCSLATLALASLVAVPAWADEAEQAQDPAIIVVGRAGADDAEMRVRQTAGGANVISYQDYADKTAVSLRDTLAFSPGVYTQPRYGQEMRLSIRGSGLSRSFHMRGLTLLQDGVPINFADDNGDFQELDPIFFDHLEVYRGANALRFGSGTLGGAINGVTPSGDTAKGVYARLDGGSYDFMRGLVSAGFGDDRASAWGALSVDSGDGDRDHAKRKSVRGHLNVKLKLSDTVTTRFYGSANHIRQELPGALTEALALSRPKTGSFAGDQRRDIDSLRLQNRTRFDWGDTRWEVGAFLNSKQLFHPIHQVIDQKSTDYGAFTRLEHDAGVISFVLGGEIRRGSMHARQFVNVQGQRGGLTFDADQNARTANVYGEVRYRPMDRVSLIVGTIYADGWRKRHVNATITPAQNGRVAYDELSPKFGILFDASRDVQVYANYSRSAELPGFGEVFQTVNGTNTFIADIAPQRAWTAEVGTRGKAGWLSWDISAYRATLRGEMLQYTVSPIIPAATFNADRTLHQGVELGLTLEPTEWLRLRQMWHYSDFRFKGDASFGNNRLPVVPRHVLRSEVRVNFGAMHLAPNLEWVPQGPYADYANSHRTRGYALVGLGAGANVAKGIDVFFDARNLTGKKAIGDIAAALRATATSAIYYPVERRAIYGGVRARF